ncbi:MAG: hypothetical protein BWY11_02436 [Firmicutes bacterium ADurb.Bin182]|nr:MAG: hypothetical protein BWY11_02436 [Firmicutes bacterium ADurb.Bin182]
MAKSIMDKWHKGKEATHKKNWRNAITGITIGGLGDIKKKAIRFNYYSIEEMNGRIMVCPEFDADNKPETQEVYTITGQELLVSLHNLYERINRPTDKRPPYDLLIAEWCKRHTHPYNVSGILEEMAAIDDDQSFYHAQGRLERYASFELDRFIRDLSSISHALDMYVAITDLQTRNDGTMAKNLYYEGIFDDGLPFFEKYRNTRIKLTDEILITYASLFPDLSMKLEYQGEDKKFVIAPVVYSIFDIAWYTLSCMSGMTGAMENGYTKLPVSRCECCNMLFVKTGNRQKYCSDQQCQAYRNNKKSKAYEERKKSQS